MMIEIFKTNVPETGEAEKLLKIISDTFPGITVNFDLNDRDKILRVEGEEINTGKIASILNSHGFSCKVIPDKVCKPEFWEASFQQHQAMWGLEPALAAVVTKDLFLEKGIKNILIPGIGYGRNAKPFKDNGMDVTGIEISQTAINLAKTYDGLDIKIHHGSVTDMPFDDKVYDGIFCYGLVYLLAEQEREKLLRDCYAQLKPGGYMMFSVISKEVPMYGNGKKLGTDWYETKDGVQMFFYDSHSVKHEFEKYGLIDFMEIDEPVGNKQAFKFLLVKCKKGNNQ